MFDYDQDGWPDLLVANDTQPNKLYKNLRNGKFKEVGVEAGLAFSSEGKARAGMGIDTGDFENTGKPGVAITNFDNEMIGLYQPIATGSANAATYDDIAIPAGLGAASRSTLGFGCAFFDANLDGWLDLAVANGHIDETVRNIRGNIGYAQPPQLFLNSGAGKFRDVAAELGGGFDTPIVGRGLAYGDFDRDGDLDLLITTNNGPAYLYRNDQTDGNRSIRFRLIGTKSNRDAIGAAVRIFQNTHNGRIERNSIEIGSRRLQLSLAIRASRNLRRRKSRNNRPRHHRLAQRRARGVQRSCPPAKPMKSLKTKGLQNKLHSNRFALLPVFKEPAIKRTTSKLLPTYRVYGNVEAPQAPAADARTAPAALICGGKLSRMNGPRWRETE